MGEAAALVAESAEGGGGDSRAVKLMCDIAAFDGIGLELVDGKLALEGRDGARRVKGASFRLDRRALWSFEELTKRDTLRRCQLHPLHP